MKKRIICLAMAIIMLTALMPTAASAASTNLEAEISTAARKMLEDYAAKVYKDNAADEAFNIFLGHGFFGFGKDLPVNEDSYFVASLFNSCVFQEALTQAITTAAIHMQKFGEDVCYITGGPGWHNYGYTYSFSGYLAPDKTDASKHMGSLITTTNYTGPTNRNDQTMELLIGGISAKSYGSQGQQRSGAVALKLGEAAILRQVTGEDPIILLDDVMSELDESRQDYILNRVKDFQVFVTCCDPGNFSKLQKGKVFETKSGAFTFIEDKGGSL